MQLYFAWTTFGDQLLFPVLILTVEFLGAVEAGIAHGLKKRAAGLLPAQDTQSVLLKLAKLSEPAAELVQKLSGDEEANKDGKNTTSGKLKK